MKFFKITYTNSNSLFVDVYVTANNAGEASDWFYAEHPEIRKYTIEQIDINMSIGG